MEDRKKGRIPEPKTKRSVETIHKCPASDCTLQNTAWMIPIPTLPPTQWINFMDPQVAWLLKSMASKLSSWVIDQGVLKKIQLKVGELFRLGRKINKEIREDPEAVEIDKELNMERVRIADIVVVLNEWVKEKGVKDIGTMGVDKMASRLYHWKIGGKEWENG
ncbi:hypothetical protein P154DRAFT_579355 [Amniculicola lignicola CBS 123094]|uniref:Uncharacterized protein n=1 Tax=Amniculicola lignicola CBS 123094 TaxID=1392246 RepID=A0A6A5W6S4_9PLEO|nr:hypothetical protein P154DRAFT_579355 [Amniculicola lignicola CBS 123094]